MISPFPGPTDEEMQTLKINTQLFTVYMTLGNLVFKNILTQIYSFPAT